MIAEAPLLARAQAGDGTAVEALTKAFRSELHVHCYRIVGSVQDAEELVQETLVASWRALAEFEGRSSVRTWLYRIATNRCLTHLRSRGRRLPEMPAPIEPGPPPPEPTRTSEPLWLEPYPDRAAR
jgi:RNA polymerase sigma-70 factor (ECF subfamily)